MNDLKNSLSSMALDLNRVAMGLHRGSNLMAERFYEEALLRKSEINKDDVPDYIRNILTKIDKENILNNNQAEEILVYSILLENFVVKRL